jgi:hypothetical protein
MPIKIRIQCACGQPYEFDVEPVNQQMPCSVQCPDCGADGTAAANEQIRLQGAVPRPAPAPKRKFGEPNLALGSAGAVAGGLAGMIIWFLITKFTNTEFGLIAWGVGALAGFGCRVLGGGYSQKLGLIAGACAVVAIIGGQYLSTKAAFDKIVGKSLEGAYEARVEYAQRAVTRKTDQEIRDFLAMEASEDEEKVSPDSIKPAKIAEFRAEQKELSDFIKGKPNKEQFLQQLRDGMSSAEVKAMVLKHSVSLWTLLWLFLGVGSAYKLGTGEGEEG